jgi:MFS family permease
MGIVSAVLGVGGGVGIVVSGLIVDNASWRWLFVVSALVVAVALVLVWRFVPESQVRAPARVDVWGGLTLSGALICTLVGLTEGEHLGWGSPAIIALFTGALALFVAWIAVEMRVDDPMVDMRMMTRRPVFFTNATALLSGFALYMVWVILPAFYQLPGDLPPSLAAVADYGFDTSVTEAGLWMLPTSLAILIAGPAAGMIGARRGSRGPLVAGMLLIAVGAAGIATSHAEPWQPALWFILCGTGIGAAFAVMPKLIMDAVDITETGIATGMNTVVRTIGGVIGAQVGAVVLAASRPEGIPVPTESGFAHAFWIGAGAALVGALAATLVTPWRRPSPHRARPAAGAVHDGGVRA